MALDIAFKHKVLLWPQAEIPARVIRECTHHRLLEPCIPESAIYFAVV